MTFSFLALQIACVQLFQVILGFYVKGILVFKNKGVCTQNQ